MFNPFLDLFNSLGFELTDKKVCVIQTGDSEASTIPSEKDLGHQICGSMVCSVKRVKVHELFHEPCGLICKALAFDFNHLIDDAPNGLRSKQ